MIYKNYTPLNIGKIKKQTSKTNPYKTILFILIFGLSLSLAGFFFYQYQKTQTQLTRATLDNTEFLVNKVGELTVLPTDETPNIATISQKDQLPDQTFFRNAQDGDKLLVFSKARKAVLYRPSINKIVEVSSINFDSDVGGASTTNISEPLQNITPAVEKNPAKTTPLPTTNPTDWIPSPSITPSVTP